MIAAKIHLLYESYIIPITMLRLPLTPKIILGIITRLN